MVLFHDRLAEVISPGAMFNPAVLDVVDAGGIRHTYVVQSSAHVHVFKENVLDEMERAAQFPRTQEDRQALIAERWLADPREGDMFLVRNGELLEIVEIGEGGSIWAAFGFPLGKKEKRAVAGLCYASADELRRSYAYPGRPVYGAWAYGTRRPEFASSPDVRLLENSPLWTGGPPSEQISKGRQVK